MKKVGLFAVLKQTTETTLGSKATDLQIHQRKLVTRRAVHRLWKAHPRNLKNRQI